MIKHQSLPFLNEKDLSDIELAKLLDFVNEVGTTDAGKRRARAIEGLKRNCLKYGHPYCPCKTHHIEDNICPCRDWRETGECICGLRDSKEASI